MYYCLYISQIRFISELVSKSCFFPLSEGAFIGGQEEIISDFKNSIAN